MQLNKLLTYFMLPLISPMSSMEELLVDKKKVLYSTSIFLFLGIIYTISVQIAYMKGLGAEVEPFIKIEAGDYYFWQRFYQIPFFFVTSIIFAGVVRIIAEVFSGKGKFEDLYSIICVAQTLPMFLTMWLPETIVFTFFPGWTFPVIPDVFRQVVGILWPLSLTVVGIRRIEKVNWFFATVLMLAGALPMTILMVIFIR